MIVPSVPLTWVPRRVPAATAVARTLRTAVVCTLSPEVNLVEGGTGAAAMVTKTVALWFAVPPVPEQEMVYVVVCVGEKDCVPDVAFVPLHPPDAVQVSALCELQKSIELSPSSIVRGLASISTSGALPCVGQFSSIFPSPS